MYNNDYIIAVDENGSPYIAHANAAGGAAGAGKSTWGTKFIAKFPNLYRMGKTAYAYTQQQADAMQRYAQGLGRKARSSAKKAWGSKAGRWIDEHDAGISEEIMRRRAKRKSRAAFKKGDASTARQYAHRAAELRDEARDERARAKRTLAAAPKRAWGSKAGRFIDEHDAGLSERLMADYYRRKGKKADKSGRHQDAEKYRARAMSLYREGKDETAAARERLRSITTRKKKK